MSREIEEPTESERANDISLVRLLNASPVDNSVTNTPEGAFAAGTDDPVPRNGSPIITKIRSRLRSSRFFFLLILSLTLLLLFLTDYFAIDTRYNGVEYNSRFFKNNPRNAILVIHIFSALTLVVVRKLLAISSEVLRWSLAARDGGTYFLNLLVLSEGTGIFGIIRIMFANYPNLCASPRVFALFRILVSYGFILVAHFILLLNIESQTAYVKYGPINGQTTHLGLGEFNFSLGEPWPFPQVDSWLFLADDSRVAKTTPTVCTPNSEGTCHSFLLLATPINYTYSCAPVGCPVAQEPISCPSENEFCDIEGIFYNVPAYLVEFKEQQNDMQYKYQLNYTSSSGTRVWMWMGNSAGNSSSSSVDFLFDMCQPEYKACDSDSYHPTKSTMYINKVNVTLILNMLNQTILDVSNITRTPYEVDISLFFQAYTAPLTYSIVNFTTIGLADNNHTLPSELTNITSNINSSVVADSWVDSAYYGLNHNLKSQPYYTRVYGFPAHALAVNARVFEPDGVNRTWIKAEPKTVLSINIISIYIFNGLTGASILVSVVMRFWFYTNDIPRECSFPDIALVCKDLDNPTLQALKNWDNEGVRMGNLAKTWIQVSGEGDDGRFSISMVS